MNKLQKLSESKLNDCNIDELNDILDIKIDTTKPVLDRIMDFLKVINNPYLFRVRQSVVKVNFVKDDWGDTIEESINKIIENQI